MRGYLNVDPDKPMRALVCPTVEGVAELLTTINGSDATAEELARTELTRAISSIRQGQKFSGPTTNVSV